MSYFATLLASLPATRGTRVLHRRTPPRVVLFLFFSQQCLSSPSSLFPPLFSFLALSLSICGRVLVHSFSISCLRCTVEGVGVWEGGAAQEEGGRDG